MFGLDFDRLVTRLRRFGAYALQRILLVARGLRGLASRAAASRLSRRVRAPLGRLARTSAIALGATLVLFIAGHLLLERIPPATIAVRQVNWGSGRGIVARDYGMGFVWALEGANTWHYLDGRTQAVSFGYPSEGANQPILAVATKEGDSAEVSVHVPYRIRAGEGHQIVSSGIKADYEKRAVAIMRRVLLQELAKLSTEDFFDPDRRRAAGEAARRTLETELAPIHLTPETVLISGEFFASGYESKMQERQLASQTKRTNESIALRESQNLEKLKLDDLLQQDQQALVAEWDERIEGERMRLEKEHAEVTRAAELYAKTRHLEADTAHAKGALEGDLALAQAESLREKLFNQTLESPGGRLYLAREAASNLRIQKVTLNSNDPRVPSVLDLDALVALLLGAEG